MGAWPPVVIVTGVPAAGKTTVSALLAARFGRSVHIEADCVQGLIVNGALWPDMEPRDEALRQLQLRLDNTSALARNFAGAEFLVVVDDHIVTRERLAAYEERVAPHRVVLVVLDPPAEVSLARNEQRGTPELHQRWAHLAEQQRENLGDTGIWIDSGPLTPEQTVDEILSRTALRSP